MEHKEALPAAAEEQPRSRLTLGEEGEFEDEDYDEDEMEEHHAAYVAAQQALARLQQRDTRPVQLELQQPQQSSQRSASSHPAATASSQLLSSLPWCKDYLERDEPARSAAVLRAARAGRRLSDSSADSEPERGQSEDEEEDDDESAALEELADLKREYGKPGSSLAPDSGSLQRHRPLPALTAALGLDTTGPAPELKAKPVELLRAPGTSATSEKEDEEAAQAKEDYDLLGLECDCPCLHCSATAVAPSFELFEQDARHSARREKDADGSELPQECECIQLPAAGCKPPLGGAFAHGVLVDALEDFFRLRTHLHRVTFARAITAAEQVIQKQLEKETTGAPQLQRERHALSLRRKAFARSLLFLQARCRRDLRHLELLESCANQLGWNIPGAPEATTDPKDLFVERAPPGPDPPILPALLREFLEYFVPKRAAASVSHYDKCALTSMCSHLLHYLVAVGDADPAMREVQDAIALCERMQVDLPLADMVETELYKHVEARLDAAEAEAAAAADAAGAAAVDAAHGDADAAAAAAAALDARVFPSATSAPGSTVLEAFAGHWVIAGLDEPSGFSASKDQRTPPLLLLRPAVPTRSKMSAYEELERHAAASTAAAETGALAAASSPAAAASSSSPSPSLSLSTSSVVRVVVPHSLLELLSEAFDGRAGRGWSVELEIARYGTRRPSPGETATVAQSLFHITKAGHVSCT